jgi:hypothetical protein
VIVELNPAKWFGKKPVVAAAVSMPAKAVESNMSTAAVVPGAPAQSGFVRFIDAIGNFFKKSAPELEAVAQAAEPFLALSPFGPEYDLVVNAVVGVQQTATASLAAGVGLTGVQKMALVLEAVTPGLTQILASKKVTSGIPAAISQFAQNVYNLQTGPTTTVAPGAVVAPVVATVAAAAAPATLGT